MTQPVHTQDMQRNPLLHQVLEHSCGSAAMLAMISPGADHQAGLPGGFHDRGVVALPNRVFDKFKSFGIRRTPGEDVRHQQSPKAPALGVVM
jgi:hypothetical protein